MESVDIICYIKTQFFFKKGYVDRVILWLESFIEEVQDKLKVADEELNNVRILFIQYSYSNISYSLLRDVLMAWVLMG